MLSAMAARLRFPLQDTIVMDVSVFVTFLYDLSVSR